MIKDKTMEERKTTSAVIEKLEEKDWTAYFSRRHNEDNIDVELESSTDAGQDLIVPLILPDGFTLAQLAKALYDYWESYDPDEEASIWIGPDGHGANGAPYRLSDLVADMEDAKNMIYELFEDVNSMAKDDEIKDTKFYIA